MGFNFFKSFSSKKGYTITEVMVGVALLSIVTIGGLTAFDQLGKTSIRNETNSSVDDRVSEIIENIRQQPTTQILQYAEPSEVLSVNSLKMGWSHVEDKPLSQCQNCQGRYGYVITPASEATSDLYLVTIWFTHLEWGDEIKKFEFLVSK